MLQCILKLVTDEQNEEMIRLLDLNKVKRMVVELSGDGAYEPDEFSRLFFQSFWDIIGEDITKLVRAFFVGKNCLNSLLIPIWCYCLKKS